MSEDFAGKSVLFVVRGGDTIPSCRFRAYQFREPLQRLGIRATYAITEKSRNPLKQLAFHHGLGRLALSHDAVVFQKLLEPLRLLFLRSLNPNTCYDFDDAMYAAPDGCLFPATIKAAPKVIAGNPILAERARRFNPRVEIIPTAVEIPRACESLRPADHNQRPAPEKAARPFPASDCQGAPVISWVGTSANLPFLRPVEEALGELRAEGRPVTLHIMTDKPERAPKADWISVEPWSREGEERHFRSCDIGLMPLEDTEWCAGKCACKALQYLSFGKPVITSPIGVNADIFADGRLGALARCKEEWKRSLLHFLEHEEARREAGSAGRLFVKQHYDLDILARKLAAFLFT